MLILKYTRYCFSSMREEKTHIIRNYDTILGGKIPWDGLGQANL